MADTNGRNLWLRWTAGIITTLFITALTFIGTNVVANDNASRDRDTTIKAEAVEQERRLETKIDNLQDTVNTGQTDILVAIQEIKGKIDKYHD